MSITGAPENAPYRVGYPIADTIGGITAAFAIASALADRDRTQGYFIDVSMLEATLATMGWAVSNYLVSGRDPAPMGNDNVTSSPSGTFRTGHGLLNIAANKQEQYEAVCRVVEREDLIADPRFAERQARLETPPRTEAAHRKRARNTRRGRMVAPVQRGRRAGRAGVQRAAGAGASAGQRARHDREVPERAGGRSRHPCRTHGHQDQRRGAARWTRRRRCSASTASRSWPASATTMTPSRSFDKRRRSR